MKFGSLFAGIGGIDLGLERAGMTCAWQVENDDYAVRVLEKHGPHIRRFRDCRDVGAHNLEPVDLIAGGFPCQDISAAGRGAGLAGERSGLWREFARIIRELRPRYVLVENVPMLLHRGIDIVLGDLAALGYSAEWDCLPAAAFGAPHRRDRVFIIAYASSNRREWWQHKQEQKSERCHTTETRSYGSRGALADASIERGWRLSVQSREQGQEGADAYGRGQGVGPDALRQRRNGRPGIFQAARQTGRLFTEGDHPWAVEPTVGRVAHGVPHRVHRLRGLGNAVVPQIAEWLGRLILDYEESQTQ